MLLLSGHVLELAAGTGIVTRALAWMLPAAVAIIATAVNRAMLAQAKSHAGLERIRSRVHQSVPTDPPLPPMANIFLRVSRLTLGTPPPGYIVQMRMNNGKRIFRVARR